MHKIIGRLIAGPHTSTKIAYMKYVSAYLSHIKTLNEYTVCPYGDIKLSFAGIMSFHI
jgi:hypothetical protein